MKSFDSTALKLFFSVTAILFAMMSHNASATAVRSNLPKPTITNLKAELKSCSIPYSTDYCATNSYDEYKCNLRNSNFLNSLNTPPFLQTSTKPLCSSPSQKIERHNES